MRLRQALARHCVQFREFPASLRLVHILPHYPWLCIFYGLFSLIGRNWPLGVRLFLAVAIEGAWEIFENSDFIINRYREATISLDYYGDSVINSVSDIVAMVVGFYAASRMPVWNTLALAVAMELAIGALIRDNLTLNIIMLIHPLEVIKQWQGGA